MHRRGCLVDAGACPREQFLEQSDNPGQQRCVARFKNRFRSSNVCTVEEYARQRYRVARVASTAPVIQL